MITHSLNKFVPLNNGEQGSANSKELRKAASEFEAFFINSILKEMRKGRIKGGVFGNDSGEETYRSMLDDQLSRIMAEAGGIGLRDVMMDNLVSARPETEGALPGDLSQTHGKTDAGYIPLKGRVSSPFGWRKDPFSGRNKFHGGLDIAAPEGSPIHPFRQGEVVFSGRARGYGNLVIVRHANGYISRYAHNMKNLVREGDHVDKSDVVALVGKTGRATGPHLHFEVSLRGKTIDPKQLING